MVSKLFFLFMFLRAGLAVGQCGSKVKLSIAILYDSNPGENTVVLTDIGTGVDTTIALAQIAEDAVSTDECVDVDTIYKITFKDSGGDGITSPNYAMFSINDRVIASLSDFGSEAVYYFSSSAQECSGSRWVLDIKYDTTPAAKTATLTDSAGTVSFSLAGFNLAFLAGQFIQIDRCIPDGSYTFSITAPTGFASPGFYRTFFESMVLSVGGGDNGFQGTESTTFDVVDTTPAPTPAPAPKACDDAFEEKYVDPDGATQNCIYLQRRPSLIPTHCVEDSSPTSPTSAYELCQETCGRCTDMCEDNDQVKFELNGKSGRNCEYVRVRLSFDFDKFFPLFCVGTNATTSCPESCGGCDMIIVNGTSPTEAPGDDSGREDPCVDSSVGMIWADQEEKSCEWLAALDDDDEKKAEYCDEEHVSNAYNVCAGTCGKCSE